jgi:histidine ammonia-lyase
MKENRLFAERLAARGDVIYGLSVGVGIRKKSIVPAEEMLALNRRIIRDTATGQGPAESPEVTRATAIVLLNTLAAGRTNVRPLVALAFAERLSNGPALAPMPMYGSTGIGDVVPLAHLASDLLGDLAPAAGEALPLIGQSSMVTASAAISFHDASALLEELAVLAALDVEAYAANPSPYHAKVADVRPYPGYIKASAIIRGTLEGSALLSETPRHLQAPLTFRGAAAVLGAAFDAFGFVEQQVQINLNAAQQNPLALPEEDRMVPCANFDMQAVAAALDFARIALGPCLTAQVERSIKLLQARDSGLTDGLEPRGDGGVDGGESGHGFSGMVFTLQAMAAEARLLASPVSYEVGTSSQEEGVGDRLTLAGLGARRLREMTDLGFRIAALGTVFAAEAIELRGVGRLGVRALELHARVRKLIPGLVPGSPPPTAAAMGSLTAAMRAGLLARAAARPRL